MTGRDLLGGSYRALAGHLGELDRAYGVEGARRYVAVGDRSVLTPVLGESTSLPALASWASDVVRGV